MCLRTRIAEGQHIGSRRHHVFPYDRGLSLHRICGLLGSPFQAGTVLAVSALSSHIVYPCPCLSVCPLASHLFYRLSCPLSSLLACIFARHVRTLHPRSFASQSGDPCRFRSWFPHSPRLSLSRSTFSILTGLEPSAPVRWEILIGLAREGHRQRGTLRCKFRVIRLAEEIGGLLRIGLPSFSCAEMEKDRLVLWG